MFSLNDPHTHLQVIEMCMPNLYQAVDQYVFALNADMIALNTSLQQD